MESQQHSRLIKQDISDGQVKEIWHIWNVERLWHLSEGLPIIELPIDLFNLDKNLWFGKNEEPTVIKVIEHARRIQEADCSYPIILCPERKIMDGLHRISKLLMWANSTVNAKIFTTMPKPCLIEEITNPIPTPYERTEPIQTNRIY